MRITDSLFYMNSKNSYQDSLKKLYDVNAQISSGSKIQNSYEDSGIYVDSMRLDNEIATLGQVKESSSKAATFADNTDATMNQFSDTLIKFKSKLIQAANGANSPTSLDAIANDLQAMRNHLQSIANTSIDGQYLFSGSALEVKPISNDGSYNGNEESMHTLIGSNTKLAYNIDGKSLFLGKDNDYKKIISTNVKMYSDSDKTKILKTSDTVEDLMSNNGGGSKPANATYAYFYIQGKNSNGSSFKKKIDISPDEKVETLINKIKDSYTPPDDIDVSLNDYGQIEIKDKNNGKDSLDFSMVGSYSNSDDDSDGTKGVDDLKNVVSFVKSNFASSDVAFDRNKFITDGDTLSSNVSQVVKSTSDYATASTKLSDTAGVSLDGEELVLKVHDINGNENNSIKIDFKNNGSTFNVNDGKGDYNIYAADGSVVNADDMTYQQLNDVISMIVSNNLPATTNTKSDYDAAVIAAKKDVDVSLDYRGKLQIKDKTNPSTNIKFSMYDKNSTKFDGSDAPALSFMSNNAIAADKPHVDFFKDLDSMIKAVRGGNFSMNSNFSDPRNLGIENSILRIDHIMDHVTKLHTKIGSYSNALQSAGKRVDFLSLNVKTIKSQVADVDIGEAYMKFTQISNNYKATLSTVAKINSMSLLNYM